MPFNIEYFQHSVMQYKKKTFHISHMVQCLVFGIWRIRSVLVNTNGMHAKNETKDPNDQQQFTAKRAHFD